jgi:phytoene dehydrogenase-like protein
LFQGEAAQRVLPALSMHTDVAPSDRFGAGLGYLLGLSAATAGFPVPRGGARAITNALVTLLEAHGGRLRLGAHVDRIVVKDRRAVAVRLSDGEEIAVKQAVLADTGAPALYLRLLDADHVPRRVIKKMKGFARGWGTLKVDWALSGPVPWEAEPACRSAVVHTGEDLDDLDRFATEVRAGKLPERPYLVIGQQSLADDSRAPRNQHTLYAYSRVPSRADWSDEKDAFADRIEQRIEALAPGFVRKILGRSVSSPADLQADNENLVGGDIAGGSGAWNHQLMFRPVFPYFRYRTPVARLYLCSSYAHPGAGVHGMCGYNAALMALRDIG